MTTIINVEVEKITPSKIEGGTVGSYGFHKLSFRFSAEWKGLGKRIVFYIPRSAPVALAITDDTAEYDIPAEVKAYAGEIPFTIEGYFEDNAIYTVSGVVVVESSSAKPTRYPSTPSEVQQIYTYLSQAQRLYEYAFNPKGTYSDEEAYNYLDVIEYNNDIYIAKKFVKGVEPTDGEYYMLAMKHGESAYEIAIRLGTFEGTEEEWNNYIAVERDKAIDAIVKKGAETLATIPEDYTELSNQLNLTTTIRDDLPEGFNIDGLSTTGIYFLSGSKNYVNMPEGETGGMLINIYTASITRRYQTFYSYQDHYVYIRKYKQTKWSLWERLATVSSFSVVPKVLGTLPDSTNLNDVIENSIYFISSDNNHVNIPDGETSGMLLTFYHSIYRHYQLFISYNDDTVYIRHSKEGTFGKWVVYSNKIVSIAKDEENKFTINFGDFSTNLIYYDNDNVNRHAWNLNGIYRGNYSLEGLGDIIGPIKIRGNSDHVGGVHGDERTDNIHIIIGGMSYTELSQISRTYGKSLTLILKSSIYDQNTQEKLFDRFVQIVFSPNKMVVSNSYKAVKDCLLERATNGGLLSAYSENIKSIILDDYYTGANPTTSIDYKGKARCATINTKYGSMTMRNIIGGEGENYQAMVHIFTDENPVRAKIYFDVYKYGEYSIKSGETIYGQFEYLFS